MVGDCDWDRDRDRERDREQRLTDWRLTVFITSNLASKHSRELRSNAEIACPCPNNCVHELGATSQTVHKTKPAADTPTNPLTHTQKHTHIHTVSISHWTEHRQFKQATWATLVALSGIRLEEWGCGSACVILAVAYSLQSNKFSRQAVKGSEACAARRSTRLARPLGLNLRAFFTHAKDSWQRLWTRTQRQRLRQRERQTTATPTTKKDWRQTAQRA